MEIIEGKLTPIKVANFCKYAVVLWGVFILAPTWLEAFEKYNSVAMAVFTLFLAVQAYALSLDRRTGKAARKDN